MTVLGCPSLGMLKLLLVTLFAEVVCFYVDVGAECVSNSIPFMKAMWLQFQQERASFFFSFDYVS